MSKRDWLKHLGFTTGASTLTNKITPMANEPTIEMMDITIARFMGMEGSDDFIRQNYRYHRRWELMMPVVEKIEGLDNSRFGFTIDPLHVIVTDYKGKGVEIIWVHKFPDNGDTKLSMTYNAVCQFITWYNQQKQAVDE